MSTHTYENTGNLIAVSYETNQACRMQTKEVTRTNPTLEAVQFYLVPAIISPIREDIKIRPKPSTDVISPKIVKIYHENRLD